MSTRFLLGTCVYLKVAWVEVALLTDFCLFVSSLYSTDMWKKKTLFFSIIVGYQQSKDNKWRNDDWSESWGEKKKNSYGQNGEGPMEKRQLLFGSSGLLPFRDWVLCYQSFQFFKRSPEIQTFKWALPSFSVLAQTDAFCDFTTVWHIFQETLTSVLSWLTHLGEGTRSPHASANTEGEKRFRERGWVGDTFCSVYR